MSEFSSIIGSIDHTNSRSIRGWCWDFSQEASLVEFFANGKLIGSCIANEYRSDLEVQNIRAGLAAFRFEIPSKYSGVEIEARSNGFVLPKPSVETGDSHFIWRKKRVSLILDSINLASGRGIEFGPLHDPIIDPSNENVIFVDHADQLQLVEKYRNDPNVDIREIVRIDFVYSGENLSGCINEFESLDYAISSHVGEHVPDFIGWLKDIRSVLKYDGKLVMALPDKRYCWDANRNVTTTEDMAKAHKRNLRRPSFKMIWESKYKAVARDGKITWYTFDKLNSTSEYTRVRNNKDLLKTFYRYFVKREYLDVHCSVFSADTFPDLIQELREMHSCAFVLENIYGPEGNEFIAVLRPN